MQFVSDNAAWSQAHPEEAARILNEKLAAESGDEPAAQPAAEGSP